VEWDSWRRSDGQWTVAARFTLPEGSPSSIGEEPPALWTFHPIHRTVANANRWAQQLSELEPLDGPAPRRRLSAVSDRPFDVDAPEALRRSDAAVPTPLDREAELLDMLRARRGQRLGVDEDGDDALALLLTHGIPAAHPRPAEAEGQDRIGHEPDAAAESTDADGQGGHDGDGPAGTGEDHDERTTTPRGGITSLLSRLTPRTDTDDHLGLRSGLSSPTREITLVPSAQPGSPDHHGGAGRDGNDRTRPEWAEESSEPRREDSDRVPMPAETRAEPPQAPGTEAPRRSSRPKRSSVPSWDEIVFGTKGD
jgi:hypothetical protein